MAIHCGQYATQPGPGVEREPGNNHTMVGFMGRNADRSPRSKHSAPKHLGSMNVKCCRILAASVFCADCLLSSQQIENVDACLSFLDARGVNVQGLSAEGKQNKQ